MAYEGRCSSAIKARARREWSFSASDAIRNEGRTREFFPMFLMMGKNWNIKGAVRYKKLLHMLIDENRTITDLQRQAGYSANRSTRLRNGIYISFESVEKICRVLECKIDEIIKLATEEVTRNGK